MTQQLAAAAKRTIHINLAAARFFGLALLIIMLPVIVEAQTLNPRTAEFSPSADHSTSAADGTPLVQSYQIEFYLTGASAPFQTASLGKPTPQSDGKIHVDLSTIFLGWPVPGTARQS